MDRLVEGGSVDGGPVEDDVVDQADALMGRYRNAQTQPAGDTESVLLEPFPAPSAPPDRELPVLTDVFCPVETPSGQANPHAGNLRDDFSDVLRDSLRRELEATFSQWLAEALPAALARANEQMLVDLDAQARRSLLPCLHETLAAHRPQRDG